MSRKKNISVCLAVFILCIVLVQLVSVYRYPSRTSSLLFKNVFSRNDLLLERMNFEDESTTTEVLHNKEAVIESEIVEPARIGTSVQIQPNIADIVDKQSESMSGKKLPLSLLGSPLLKTPKHTSTFNTPNKTSVGATGYWKEGTFCHQFLVNTFQMPISVCAKTTTFSQSSVKCFGSPYSQHMSTCILENVVVSPRLLAQAMWDADHTKFNKSEPSIALLGDRETKCHNISLSQLREQVESGDYMWQVVDQLKEERLLSESDCEQWIEDDVIMFTAHRFHIYFRFLDYFNVHKLLEDFGHTLSSRYYIVRMSGSDNYHFSKFDQALFPEVEVQSLDHLDDVRTCFKKVILVPKSYASVLYQCKMPSTVRQKCVDCDGRGLTKTQISTFRNRVLKACSLSDSRTLDGNSSIIFVSRQPYLRNKNDKINHFERVMDNEKALLLGLRKKFNSSIVQRVQFEGLGLCEQIRIVHNSDVYLGVHGAGLVHLWWLKEDALVYEMMPHYEIGNPTFSTLARLSGRRYRSSAIGGGWGSVHAHVSTIVNDLEKQSGLPTSTKNSARESPTVAVTSALLKFPNKLIML